MSDTNLHVRQFTLTLPAREPLGWRWPSWKGPDYEFLTDLLVIPCFLGLVPPTTAIRDDQGQARPWVSVLTAGPASGLVPHGYSIELAKWETPRRQKSL